MEDQDYERVRQRVARRLWLRASFFFNLAFFVLVMLAILTDAKSAGDSITGAAGGDGVSAPRGRDPDRAP